MRKGVLGSLGASMLACGFDTSGIGSSGEPDESSSTATAGAHEGGGDDAVDAGDGDDDDGAVTNDDGMASEGPRGTTGATGNESEGGSPCGDWWDEAWSRRRGVIIGDIAIDMAVADVPVMVLLDSSRIDYSAAQVGGTDLRFVSAAGQVLAHEIETWNPDGTSFVWLRIPMIAAQGQAQPRVDMYWGNPAATDDSMPQDVWEPAFVSVHHLRNLEDSTVGAHHGESPTPPSAVEGWIGGAGGFDGYDDHVKLMGEAAYDLQDAITIEAWIRVGAFTDWYQAIVTKGDDSWRLHREAYTDFVGFGTDTPSSDNDNLAGMTTVNDGEWHYVVAVYGNDEKRLFVDGEPDAAIAYPGPINLSDYDVLIGENQQNAYRFFEGEIDEVRISNVARGRGWIKVQTESMNDELLEYGSEETCP